jgi:glycosyltransferase involved in cell wall biosynthesis
VVGEFYEETAPYEAAFAALDASRVLRVHRYVNDSEIPRYFAATDLVLLPYISATQSGIRAIAQAYQRPVLCSAVGGLSEGLEESQEGFVATDLTPNALAEQIASLFESGRLDAVNNTLRARYAKPEQAWDQFADAFIAFTESLPSKKD